MRSRAVGRALRTSAGIWVGDISHVDYGHRRSSRCEVVIHHRPPLTEERKAVESDINGNRVVQRDPLDLLRDDIGAGRAGPAESAGVATRELASSSATYMMTSCCPLPSESRWRRWVEEQKSARPVETVLAGRWRGGQVVAWGRGRGNT
jgi:hypothetical protein